MVSSRIASKGRQPDLEAFLLNNGRQYHYAHLFGLAEYIVSSYVWPDKFGSIWCSSYALLGCKCQRSRMDVGTHVQTALCFSLPKPYVPWQ